MAYMNSLPPLNSLQVPSIASLHRCLSDEEMEEMNDAFKPRSRLSVAYKPMRKLLHNSKGRRLVGDFIESNFMHFFMGVLIVCNSVLVIMQTDARARKEKVDLWEEVASTIMMMSFILEVACRIYAQQRQFFCALFNLVELAIVAGDLALTLYSWTEHDTISVGYLRLMRLARFFRILRIFTGFRELFMMLHGMQSTMKAMIWSVIMVFVVILIWGIIAVEFIRPAVRNLAEDGHFTSARCGRAFDSVWQSALTLMSTIIAGDAWGEIAMPMMEIHPSSAVFFFGSFMMINLGLMNLIMAVIVDRAAEARREDEEHILQEKKNAYEGARVKLFKLCRRLDKDRDGILSVKELQDGVFNEPEFADILKLMDVTMEDLDQVFSYLDLDQSGDVTYKEFIHQLHRLKTADSHTVLILLGQQVKQIYQHLNVQLVSLRRSLSPFSMPSDEECRSMGFMSQRSETGKSVDQESLSPPCFRIGEPMKCDERTSGSASSRIGEPKDVAESAVGRHSLKDGFLSLSRLQTLDAALTVDLERMRKTLHALVASAHSHSRLDVLSDTAASSTDLQQCSSKCETPSRRRETARSIAEDLLRPSGRVTEHYPRCDSHDLKIASRALVRVRSHFPRWPTIHL